MPSISNVVLPKVIFMPNNYTIVDINFTDADEPKFRLLAEYLSRAARDPAELYPRHAMDDKYARNKRFGFNVSALADACIRKLLHDLTADTVQLETLKTVVSEYLDTTSTTRIQIALDDSAIRELEHILKHLTRLAIPVGRVSFKGVPNRKLPLNIAIAYCYHYVLSRQIN